MKKDFAIGLVLVVAGVAVAPACSSSSKDKDSKDGGGTGAVGGVGGASGSSGASGAGSDGGGASGRGGASGASGRGGTSGSGGAAGAAGSGGCSMALGPCMANSDCCGFTAGTNVCVDTGDPTLGTACLNTCTSGATCQSGCCAQLEGGGGVCGPADLCEGGDGGTCADDLEPCMTNADCCGFAAGDNFCVDTGPAPGGIGVACLIACTAGTDCQSGCCAALSGGTNKVCAPATACQ